MGKLQCLLYKLAVLIAISVSFYSQANTLPKELVAWAHTHPIIKVGIDSSFIPFDYIDKNKAPSGDADLLRKQLSKLLPITLQVSSISNFHQEYKHLLKGHIDTLSGCFQTKSRKKQVLFSTPLLYLTPILVVNKNKALKNGNDLKQYHKVAFMKKYTPFDYKKYIHAKFINVGTALKGYQLVENGTADAFMSYLYLYQYTQSKHQFKNLKPIIITHFKPVPIGFCVNKKKPELVRILNWGINKLGKNFMTTVQEQWQVLHASENRLHNHKRRQNSHSTLNYLVPIFVIILLIGLFFSKQFITRIAHEIDTKYFRVVFFSVLMIIILFLLVVSNLFLSEYQKKIMIDQQAIFDLAQKATEKSVINWYTNQQESVFSIVNDAKFINMTSQLVLATDKHNRILVEQIRKKMHDYFINKDTITHQKITYTISNTDGKYLLNYIKSAQGKTSPIKSERPKLFNSLLNGQPEFIPPVWSTVNKDSHDPQKNKVPVIFIASPIRNKKGNIIAVFGLRLDPNKDFSNLFVDKRLGKSFKNYAIDNAGYMISNSTFSSELQKDGTIPFDKSTVLQAYLPNHTNNSIINNSEFASVGKNLTGYLNYYGKEVVGQWLPIKALHFTLVSEVTYLEMYTDYIHFRYFILLGLIVTGAIIFSFSFIILTIARRANEISKRSQHELTLQVQERTKELGASELRNKLINSSIADGVVGVDKQGTIIFVNQSAIDLTGIAEQSLLSSNVMDSLSIINSPAPSFKQTYIYKSIRTKQILRVPHLDVSFNQGPVLSIGLSIAPIKNDDSKLAAVIVFRDISERLKSADRIEKILEHLPICVLIINKDNKIEQVNEAGTILVGYSREEIIGKSADTLINPEFAQQQREMIKEFFRDPDTFDTNNYDKVFQLTNKAGEIIDASRVYTPVNFHDGIRAVVLIRDISSEVKAKEALVEAKNLADETNKYKSDFLANMSHEIRTPMNAIIGMSNLALNCDLGSKPQQYIRKVNSAAQSLLKIINDILDISKIEACKLEIENVNCTIYSIFEYLSNILGLQAFEKKLELLFSISSDVPNQIISDPLRIGQILINLVNNAIKFTEQGQIIVSLVLAEQQQLGNITLAFAIEDTGIGLSEEQQNKLFQSFSQADSSTTRKYGGTGLGLSISKNLIELMGGEIHLHSKQGHGSTFSFTIECKIAPVSKMSLLPKQAADFAHCNILIVDDNLIALDILKAILLSFNCNVSSANSGQAAIDILNNDSVKFDLIMVDSNMPELDGIQTCQLIKDKFSYTNSQFILITPNSRDDIQLEKQQHNIRAVIAKPVFAENVLKAMQALKNKNLKTASIDQNSETQLPQDNQSLHGCKILLVDNNLLNQKLVVSLLAKVQIEVQCANNGQEAVDLVKQQKFACILMKLQMLIMDGYMATKIIRETHPHLPIIAMTENVSANSKAYAFDMGMNDCISNNGNSQQMLATISKWVLQSSQTNIDIFPGQILATAPTNTLPNFKNIDVNIGILIANNDAGLYLKLLYEFIKEQLKFQQTFKNAWKTAQHEVAIGIVHTLQKSAANIGAETLHTIAKKLEKSYENSDNHRINELFLETTERLNNVLTELTDYFSTQNKKQPHSAFPEFTEFTFTKALIVELDQLLELVTQFETDAAEAAQLISLQLQKAKISIEFETIVEQIKNYDFTKATTSLQLFIKTIKLQNKDVEE